METDLNTRLEPMLRQAQLLFPKSNDVADAKEFQKVYSEICRLMLDQQVIQSLWHEPLLLQLNWLFKERPPNPQIFGGLTNQLRERESEAKLVNDLFFSILSNSFSAEDVYKTLSSIRAPEQSLLSRFVASGH